MATIATRHYLQALVTVLLACLLAVAAFNYHVNPDAVFGYRTVTEADINRIDQFPVMRFSKPWQIRQLKPDALVLGSSRAGGISPGITPWSGYRGYNAAVPGMTVDEMRGFISLAQAQAGLKALTLVLDLEMFLEQGAPYRQGYEPARMAAPSPARTIQAAKDIARALYSTGTLSRSLLAASGKRQQSRHYYLDGSWETTGRFLIGRPGYRLVAHNHREFYGHAATDMGGRMSVLAHILAYCHSENIDTRIIVSPMHAFVIELLHELGHAESIDRFYRELVAINESSAQAAGRAAFPLLAFNHLEGIVDETLSETGASPSWFQDGIHFRRKLGSLMMRSAWEQADSQAATLTRSSLPAYLEKMNRLHRDFVANHQVQLEELLGRAGYRE